MKYSLLDNVQDNLEAIDGDEVNDIDETVESRQVTTHAKHAYNRVCERAGIPEQMRLFQLNASGDPSLPVLMYRPDTARSVDWIKYNKETEDDTRNYWVRVEAVSLEEFLHRSYQLNPADTTVGTMTVAVENNEFEVFYRNDVGPSYYAVVEDHMILFNSIDLEVDTTLQSNKTLCYGSFYEAFQRTNGFTPSFDDHYHQLWFEETAIRVAIHMKEMANPDAERWARRLWNRAQKIKEGVQPESYYDRLPNYGKK